MTSLVRRVSALPVAILGALVAALFVALAPSLAARGQDGDKSVFVSVVGNGGKPVTDLTAERFVVSEDNVQREVKSVKPAAQPVFIELLADTSKLAGSQGMGAAGASGGSNLIQDVRTAFNGFVSAVWDSNPANQIALMEFGQAGITMVKFTSKPDDMAKGIAKLFPKPSADPVLAEAITQAASDLLKTASPRRVIMILNIEPGFETSPENAMAINDAVRKSGASLWCVSLQPNGGVTQNKMHEVILGGIAHNTGGRREIINGQSAMVDNLKMYWGQIANQYEVVYARPAGTKSATRVTVSLRAEGVQAYFNQYAPK